MTKVKKMVRAKPIWLLVGALCAFFSPLFLFLFQGERTGEYTRDSLNDFQTLSAVQEVDFICKNCVDVRCKSCESEPNDCGQKNIGEKCSGCGKETRCDALIPSNPSFFGASCTIRDVCGRETKGYWRCSTSSWSPPSYYRVLKGVPISKTPAPTPSRSPPPFRWLSWRYIWEHMSSSDTQRAALSERLPSDPSDWVGWVWWEHMSSSDTQHSTSQPDLSSHYDVPDKTRENIIPGPDTHPQTRYAECNAPRKPLPPTDKDGVTVGAGSFEYVRAKGIPDICYKVTNTNATQDAFMPLKTPTEPNSFPSLGNTVTVEKMTL